MFSPKSRSLYVMLLPCTGVGVTYVYRLGSDMKWVYSAVALYGLVSDQFGAAMAWGVDRLFVGPPPSNTYKGILSATRGIRIY